MYSPQMTDDSLVFTNLLIYSPVASSAGVVRMDEAVIPIECHYERSILKLKLIFKDLWTMSHFLIAWVFFGVFFF